MDQPNDASSPALIPALINEPATKDKEENRLAGEVFLFLHAGGVPIDALAQQLTSLGCFGRPNAHFDLDGPMWSRVQTSKASSFANYLNGVIDSTDKEAGVLSALVDYRDLLWLEQRPIFREQLSQKLRAVRLAFLDPALQAYRRAAQLQDVKSSPPGFADVSRELIEIEEAECQGDRFCKRHGLPMVKLWVEDLARPGVPALRGLLSRWSIALPEQGRLIPIEPPSRPELEAVADFRAEAGRRHWSHALLPTQS